MNWLLNKLESWVLKGLSLPHTSDVLMTDKAGNVYKNGAKLPKEELKQLRNEAEFLVKTHLWKILTDTPKEKAKEMMFDNENIKGGKYVLYTISLQENVLKILGKETFDEAMAKVVKLRK